MLFSQASENRHFTHREISFVCFERSTKHDCSAMFVVEGTTAFCFRCKRRESPNERLGTRPASTHKHYSPLAATSRSALRCSCRNCSVRSLVQSKVTPESTANSRWRWSSMFSTSIATAANMGAPSIGSWTTRAGPRAVNARLPLPKIVSATFGCSRSRASDSRQRFNLNRNRRSPARRGAVIGMAWTSPFSVLSTAIVLSGQSGNGLRFLHCC